jgi:transposase
VGIKKERKSFPKEFKKEVVRVILEEGRRVSAVAQEFDIHPNVIHRWKREYLLDNENAFSGGGHLNHPTEKMHQLQKELKSVKEERDILKKALAILSNPSR